jgi:hypothetical protein
LFAFITRRGRSLPMLQALFMLSPNSDNHESFFVTISNQAGYITAAHIAYIYAIVLQSEHSVEKPHAIFGLH